MRFTRDGKTIGEFNNITLDYTSERDESKHLMQIYGQSWGISSDVIQKLNDFKCIEIRIRTSNNVYKVSMDKFNDNCIEAEHGAGLQKFLPLKFWTKETKVEMPEEQTSLPGIMTAKEYLKMGMDILNRKGEMDSNENTTNTPVA